MKITLEFDTSVHEGTLRFAEAICAADGHTDSSIANSIIYAIDYADDDNAVWHSNKYGVVKISKEQ